VPRLLLAIAGLTIAEALCAQANESVLRGGVSVRR
jgi:hypothetical protein